MNPDDAAQVTIIRARSFDAWMESNRRFLRVAIVVGCALVAANIAHMWLVEVRGQASAQRLDDHEIRIQRLERKEHTP